MKHTPFDGSYPAFRIGLAPLDLANWIEVDEHLGFHLDEKERYCELHGDKVFAAEENTEEAQREILDLLINHLPSQFPDTHQLDGQTMRIGKREVDLQNAELSPLQIAGQLVQEDLIIMRRGDDGWRLAAASLCFPSSWSLKEKFSKVLAEVHAPVPGFGLGSRNADMLTRIFDNLLPEQPVWRYNWSVYSNDELYHDDRSAEYLDRQGMNAGSFLRIEYQTLRKLEKSSDALFTIRIHLDPLSWIKTQTDRARICEGFIKSLEELDDGQLAYKGLSMERSELLEILREMGKDESLPDESAELIS